MGAASRINFLVVDYTIPIALAIAKVGIFLTLPSCVVIQIHKDLDHSIRRNALLELPTSSNALLGM